MPGLRNITRFPHAEGRAVLELDPDGTPMPGTTMRRAMARAVEAFRAEHGRAPEWDVVSFRGCFSMFECLVEFWEEEL